VGLRGCNPTKIFENEATVLFGSRGFRTGGRMAIAKNFPAPPIFETFLRPRFDGRNKDHGRLYENFSSVNFHN